MIKITNVNKFYNKNKANAIHVLNDISLELPDSGMVAIFGRSGCGKTTLLNVIGGLDRINDGTISIDGNNIKVDSDTLRNRDIGYIFQNYNLSNKENCYENVSSALKLCGLTDKDEIDKRVMAALDNVDMAKYRLRMPNTLSGGQMQRIAIARAIVKNPKIILADEPTGNLDEHNTIMIMDLLREISKNHLVILVTHEASLVNLYCDKIIALSDGKIINERDNQIEGSYVAKDKNSIYLGELDKKEEKNDLINLEYYGNNPNGPIDIKIINYNGKTYLQLNTPKVQVLDETSEIKLHEGVFQEAGVKKEKELRMKDIPSFEGKNYGHLFNFKDSIKTGFKENFRNKKVGNIVLKFVLFLFSLIFVIVTARFGVAIKNIADNEDKYGHNVFYVYTPSTDLSKKLDDAKADPSTGIVFTRLISRNEIDNRNMRFEIGKFETYTSNGIISSDMNFPITKLSIDIASDMKLLAGKKEIKSGEIIISSKVADKIIDEAGVGYVKTYNNLIGFKCADYFGGYYYGNQQSSYKIVGVVEDKAMEVFLTDYDLAIDYIDQNHTYHIYPASGVGYDVALNEAIYLKFYDDTINVGANLMVNGKSYTVTMVIDGGDFNAEGKNVYLYNNTLIINDEDFSKAYKYYGDYDDRLKDYGGTVSVYQTPYTVIYSNDIEATNRFLEANFGNLNIPSEYRDYFKIIYSPQMMREEVFDESRLGIQTNIISLLVFVVILSVCMYFIMHSMMMVRIKEIGIYRAIGVTKKNLIFKFWIETLILTTLTVFIGYLFASGMMAVWFAKASIIKGYLYYPVWMALAILVFLYGISSIFGLLPIVMLLRKTPSEILSKYDI